MLPGRRRLMGFKLKPMTWSILVSIFVYFVSDDLLRAIYPEFFFRPGSFSIPSYLELPNWISERPWIIDICESNLVDVAFSGAPLLIATATFRRLRLRQRNRMQCACR